MEIERLRKERAIPVWVGPTLAGIGVGCIAFILGGLWSGFFAMVITFTLLTIIEVGADLRRRQ
jgi:predicted lipid-binding transport protein (Tim44 family)